MAKESGGALALLLSGKPKPDDGDEGEATEGRESVPEAVEDALSEAFPDMTPSGMRAFCRALDAHAAAKGNSDAEG